MTNDMQTMINRTKLFSQDPVVSITTINENLNIDSLLARQAYLVAQVVPWQTSEFSRIGSNLMINTNEV